MRALVALLLSALPAFAQPAYKTGARPSPPAAIASAPRHLIGKVGAPAQYAAVPKRISWWGNNQFGDCVTVEECFAKIADNPHVWVSEQECIDWARRHGHLNGATLIDVLEDMRRDGIRADDGKVYKNGPHFVVDYRNRAVLADALYKGCVKIAIASGQVQDAMNQTGGKSGWYGVNWRVDNVDRWGRPVADHSVPLCGYGPASFLYEKLGLPLPSGVRPDEYGYLMFTWNSIGFVSHQSLVNVCVEAWVREPTTEGYPPHPEPEPPPVPEPDPAPVDPPPPGPAPVCPVPRWVCVAVGAGAVLVVVVLFVLLPRKAA